MVTLYFTSPNGDGTAILRGHPSHAKVQPLAVQRKYLHFSVILRPWVLVRPRESNPRPPAPQSNALPTELILPRVLVRSHVFSLRRRRQVQKQIKMSSCELVISSLSQNIEAIPRKIYNIGILLQIHQVCPFVRKGFWGKNVESHVVKIYFVHDGRSKDCTRTLLIFFALYFVLLFPWSSYQPERKFKASLA